MTARYISGSNEPLRRYGHSRILGHMEPPFCGRGGRRGQRWHHSKERWWFPVGSPLWPLHYRPICNHSAAICDRMSPALKSTGVTLGPNFRVFPWSRPLMFGSTESEYHKLTNREIIFEEFQPVWSQSTNVTDRRMDRQTDDMRSQDRALR